MSLSQLLQQRYSVRAFKPEPVNPQVLEEVFALAQHAPSNCNVQPWQTYVVSGEAKNRLKNTLIAHVMKQQTPKPEFNWKVAYQGIHRERQFGSANALYGAMGIEREDKMKRNMAMLRNWGFFDAPHAVFFAMEKYLDIMGAVDVGIYAQSVALLLQERGIACCMQGALGQFPEPIKEQLGIPGEQGILFGMSLGYEDPQADANTARTDRADWHQAVTFF